MQKTVSYFLKNISPLCLLPVLFSCATYHHKIERYYHAMETGQYTTAVKALDANRFLQKRRNRFIYLVEKGRALHLMGQYAQSNQLLNEADIIAEDHTKNIGQAATGILLNGMMQQYAGEDFERFMLHYYKALNYVYLGKMEDAIVEARRITLEQNKQEDKFGDKQNRYSKDAFSLTLQGILYEMNHDVNNAFIAYRNAAELYLAQPSYSYYGTKLPQQLEADVLRTAYLNGFTAELQRFEQLFNKQYKPAKASEGGELIVFFENGKAPVKEEENLMFALVKGEGGAFIFKDPNGHFTIPFDVSRYSGGGIGNLRTFRIALPKYRVIPTTVKNVQLKKDSNTRYMLEPVENIAAIAVTTMQQRRLTDITNALTRLFVKKLAEAGARSAAKSMVKNNDKSSSQNEKDEKADAIGNAIGLAIQGFSLFSEKADTRNWQSLPAQIQYVRIPLQKGANKLELNLYKENGGAGTRTITVEGNNSIQLYNFAQ